MNALPIFFSDFHAPAIEADRKTQTRRPLRPPAGMDWYDDLGGERTGWFCDVNGSGWWHVSEMSCCYGAPGDRLGAIRSTRLTRALRDYLPFFWSLVWRRFVFAWLRIVNLRVEPLQEISEADCEAEGLDPRRDCYELDDVSGRCVMRPYFAQWWDEIYHARGWGWDTNPWVWVIEFKRVAP